MTTESLKHGIYTSTHTNWLYWVIFPSTNILDSVILSLTSPVFLYVKSELEQHVSLENQIISYIYLSWYKAALY